MSSPAAVSEQWLTKPGGERLEKLCRNSLTRGLLGNRQDISSHWVAAGCGGSSWHTDVTGPSQCVIWREWPSGAPGFQAPISKVPVDATAGVVPSRLLLHSVASCDFLEDVLVSFWSWWHADELRRGLENSAGVVCLRLLGEAAG